MEGTCWIKDGRWSEADTLFRRNPVLMRSYGAYGTSTDIEFRVEQFPLIERGWVIALAHVRYVV